MFDQAVEHLKVEYGKLQVGRASGALVEDIMIDSYGATQPIKALASVSLPDARTIQISPWDKSVLGAIETAIKNSDINLNPVNNGAGIILNIPPLTEDRRRDLVKVVGRLAEEAKISVRNSRHDSMAKYKRQEHEGDMSEDERKRSEKQLQEQVDKVNEEIGKLAKAKEESIMTI